jgi:hypothetical protein
VLNTFAANMQRTRGSHLHRTGRVKPGNYYAGHHKAQGVLVTVTRSGRTELLDPRCDLRNNASTGFAWGYNGSGPAQLALAILIDYFPTKPGGKALAEALYQPFKFTVIAAPTVSFRQAFFDFFHHVSDAITRSTTTTS